MYVYMYVHVCLYMCLHSHTQLKRYLWILNNTREAKYKDCANNNIFKELVWHYTFGYMLSNPSRLLFFLSPFFSMTFPYAVHTVRSVSPFFQLQMLQIIFFDFLPLFLHSGWIRWLLRIITYGGQLCLEYWMYKSISLTGGINYFSKFSRPSVATFIQLHVI